MKRAPKLRKHSSGQAYFILAAAGQTRRYSVGRFGTSEAEAAYHRLLGEWESSGRAVLPDRGDKSTSGDTFTIGHLILAYWTSHEPAIRTDGHRWRVRMALRALRQHHEGTEAASFDTRAFKAIRAGMVADCLSRSTIKDRTNIIRDLFRWGAEEQLVPSSIWHDLQTVKQLSATDVVKQPKNVDAVPDDLIDATLPSMLSTVADLVRFQRLTGCRPGEACMMTPADIDRTCDIWFFRPSKHKTAHRGKRRSIAIGPKAQAVLLPRLLRPAGTPIFATRNGTPYTTASYRQHVHRACQRAGVTVWSPNQIRHRFATDVRKQHGLDAAQAALSHASASMTEHYGKVAEEKAAAVAMSCG